MVSDLDIYRAANLLVKQYGDEATINVAMIADALLEKGDLDGQRVWLRILNAVNQLLDNGTPDHDETVH